MPNPVNKPTMSFLKRLADMFVDNTAYGHLNDDADILYRINDSKNIEAPRLGGLLDDKGNLVRTHLADYFGAYCGSYPSYEIPDGWHGVELPGPMPKEYQVLAGPDNYAELMLSNPEIRDFLKKQIKWYIDNGLKPYADYDELLTPQESIEADPLMYTDSKVPYVRDYAKKLINGED